MSLMDINLVIGNDTVSFQMTFDPNFWSDLGMREYLLKNTLGEPEVVHLMKKVLRPGDTAIDGGANVGFFTIFMSKLVGEKGKVLAFEPGINNIQKFKDNIALNHVRNVQLIQQPLWHSSGQDLIFNLCHDSGLNSLGEFPEVLSRVKMVSAAVGDFQEAAGAKLLKLDIEGAEEFAIKGIGDAPIPFVVCEFYPKRMAVLGSSMESLRQEASHLGYELFLLHQDGSLPTLVPRHTVVSREAMPPANILFSTVEEVGKAWDKVEIR